MKKSFFVLLIASILVGATTQTMDPSSPDGPDEPPSSLSSSLVIPSEKSEPLQPLSRDNSTSQIEGSKDICAIHLDEHTGVITEVYLIQPGNTLYSESYVLIFPSQTKSTADTQWRIGFSAHPITDKKMKEQPIKLERTPKQTVIKELKREMMKLKRQLALEQSGLTKL